MTSALTFSLLRLLSERHTATCAEMASALGLSISEVSSAVDDLISIGVEIEQGSGLDCRLVSPIDWLDAVKIVRQLGDRADAFEIEVVDQTGSTNDDLLARARQGANTGLVRVAELQTAGRGRRRRVWHSGPGGALTFSLVWRFAKGPAALSGLSLAVGVSLLRSLRALGVSNVTLKWPNDLLWQQRKIGGILIETTSHADGAALAVIGIGLNLRLSTPMVQLIDQAATDLDSAGLRMERNLLLGRILSDLHVVLEGFSCDGFACLRSEWERMHAYQDKMVRLELGAGKQAQGRVLGVDDNGALLLATDDGTEKFHSGEVSLRPVGDWSN